MSSLTLHNNPHHPEFAPVAFLAALSVFLALPWHWRARNVATVGMIVWLFMTNMIYAVDAVIWADHVDDVATLWCDITTKILVGANVALPALCLCVALHLEQVASLRLVHITAADRRRRKYMEIFAGVGLPVIFMALHYIVQGHRFDIIETYGCRPTVYFSVPGIFIIWLPPILLATGCLIASAMALRHFVIRRLTFAAHLESAHPSLNTSRYLRLTAMAMMQMVWSLCITISTLIVTSQTVPLRPWTHWADVHSDWLRVDKLSLVFTPADVERSYAVLWWLIPISTFIFVGFFAFGKEAVDEYTKCIMWVKRRFLPNSSSKGRKYEKHMDGLPVYRAHTPKRGPSSALFSTNRTGFSLDEKSSITRPSVDRAASPLNSDSISTMSTDYYSPPPRAHARSSRDRFGSVAGSHGRGVYIPRMQSSAPFPHRPFLTSSPSSSSTSLVSGDSKARRIPPQLLSYNPPPPRRSSTNSTSSSSPLTHAVRMDDIPDLQFQQH